MYEGGACRHNNGFSVKNKNYLRQNYPQNPNLSGALLEGEVGVKEDWEFCDIQLYGVF